jgi:hypothetical protein
MPVILGGNTGIYLASLTPPASPLLLDTYPNAAVAYSLRQLRTAYIGAVIRVRRSSDNTEQDFGFVANVLDTASLLTFCGAGNGFVTTWYDQSGNGNNAIQSTAVNQPQIVSSGAMITTNSKNSMLFDGSGDFFNLTSTINVNTSNYNSFVAKREAANRALISLSPVSPVDRYLWALYTDNKYYLQAKTNFLQVSLSTDLTTNQSLLTGLNNAGTMSIFKNSNTITSVEQSFTSAMACNAIGNYLNIAFTNGNIQEIVFYNSEQSANRTGIETNINTFYTIY